MKNNLPYRPILAAALVTAALACSSSQITLGGDLNVTVSATTPVNVGDSLRLDYDVTGQSLAGLVISWGDMQTDSVSFLGAQTAGGSEYHVYDSAGQFTLLVNVFDQLQGSGSAQIIVTIDP